MTVKENLAYLKYFGFRLTFWKTVNKIVCDRSDGKLAWDIHNKNYRAIEAYLMKVCAPVISDLKNRRLEDRDDFRYCDSEKSKMIKKNQTIWTMWWQGEASAPPLVKACFESMRKNSNGRKVIIINEDNIKDYLCVPDRIMKCLYDGFEDRSLLGGTTLTLTHFSDVVRVMLLYQYGGLWMDSTIFLTDDVPDSYFDAAWVTLGEDDRWYVAEGKWSIFFVGATAGSEIMHYLYSMHLSYLEEKRYYVTYLMIYNILHIMYVERPDIAKVMDGVDCGNAQVLTMNRRYNDPVSEDEIEDFLARQKIHKLSWKWWGNEKDCPIHLTDAQGRMTWFGYLYDKYITRGQTV